MAIINAGCIGDEPFWDDLHPDEAAELAWRIGEEKNKIPIDKWGERHSPRGSRRGRCGMKKIEKLGISPAPWVVARWYEKTTGKPYSNINTASGFYVADGTNDADKSLIAAAPELYYALLEALPWLADIGAEVVGNDSASKIAAVVKKAEAALAKAAGEEATDGTKH